MEIKNNENGLLTPRNVRPFLIGAIIATGTIFITSYVVASESMLRCAKFITSVNDAQVVDSQPVKSVSTKELSAPK